MGVSKHIRKSGATTVKKDGKIVGNIGSGKIPPKTIENVEERQHSTIEKEVSSITLSQQKFSTLANGALAPELFPKDTILAGTVGSTAYGLATSSSDVDTLGVYVASTKSVLGLQGASEANNTIVFTSPQPDAAFHELGKYCALALKGNPTILELMFLDAYVQQSSVGDELISLRTKFLSGKAIANAYGGYAMSQAKRLTGRRIKGKEGFGTVPVNRIEKHGRHCLRLLLQGTQLLSDGTMSVNVGEYKEYLFEGGRTALSAPEEYSQLVEEGFTRLNTAAENTKLPELPDFDTINDFVVRTRITQLG